MTIHARTLMRLLTFSLWKAAASSPAPRSTTAFGIHTSSSSSPPRSPGSRLAGVGSSNDDGDDFFDDCSWRLELDGSVSASSIRRKLLRSMLTAETTFRQAVGANAAGEDDGPSALDDHKERFVVRGEVVEIQDPNGYSAVAYIPPSKPSKQSKPSTIEYLPLLVVLHGAGQNRHSALYEFTHFPAASSTSPERDQKNQSDDSPGNHIHLPPYLLSQRNAPSSLSDNFVVVAPYVGKDKRSLYDDPRGNILSFVTWFRDTWMENHSFVDANADANALQTTPPPSPLSSLPPAKIRIPPQKQYLFGFSEGATLAVELATARRFRGAILASYGFRGKLPPLALERLRGIPMWAFHSEGDDVYDVQCSETLVENLLLENAGGAGGDAGGLDAFGMDGVVKFTKLVPSEETTREDAAVGIRGREHVRAALVASRTEEVYSWLLSLP